MWVTPRARQRLAILQPLSLDPSGKTPKPKSTNHNERIGFNRPPSVFSSNLRMEIETLPYLYIPFRRPQAGTAISGAGVDPAGLTYAIQALVGEGGSRLWTP